MDIPNAPLEEWLSILDDYQKDIFHTLLQEYSENQVIDLWITTQGPSNTKHFGGDNTKNTFLENFKKEVKKFVCGHEDYEIENHELLEQVNLTKTLLVSTMSASLAIKLGVSAAIISPILVIILFSVGKISKNAFCIKNEI